MSVVSEQISRVGRRLFYHGLHGPPSVGEKANEARALCCPEVYATVDAWYPVAGILMKEADSAQVSGVVYKDIATDSRFAKTGLNDLLGAKIRRGSIVGLSRPNISIPTVDMYNAKLSYPIILIIRKLGFQGISGEFVMAVSFDDLHYSRFLPAQDPIEPKQVSILITREEGSLVARTIRKKGQDYEIRASTTGEVNVINNMLRNIKLPSHSTPPPSNPEESSTELTSPQLVSA